ncbi:NmrA/HSCARG family protein [Rhizobium sp. P28RR-XV]|uniref:NmrA/HSCARG family protein n=1 Tax=Rhizobium sp. P28RR-XV TaxID=2726737 RepID=UPI001456ADDB|nr:NmrA/HSCARG family protein [Rhizobium sp. P28RR-XV]NLR88184.1 NmrA/HSCARG family protein [Rhizobium sp. P28RR-XV]
MTADDKLLVRRSIVFLIAFPNVRWETTLMNQKKPVVVVCGATGKQGGAVTNALLKLDRFSVRALVRDPARAHHLEQRGVVLVRGDLLELPSLIEAFSGADIVYGLTQPWKPGARTADVDSEVIQGKNIIDASREVGATLVISTQIHDGEAPSGIPHADSKLEIEAYARASGIPLVNVRPASFLDNIGAEWFPVRKGKVQGLADRDAKLPYIATRDIGRAVAAVIDRLPEHVGGHVNLITGLYSGDDICAALSSLRSGESFRYVTYPKFIMWLFFTEFYKMRTAFEKMGRPPLSPEYAIGLTTTAALIEDPWTLYDFLREQGWAQRNLS